MSTLIDLRTRRQKLVGRLDPETLQLHVRWRGEEASFDLASLVRGHGGGDVLILVRADDGPVVARPPDV